MDHHPLASILNLKDYPIEDERFRQDCRKVLNAQGALVLSGFFTAVADVLREGLQQEHKVFYTKKTGHNVYLLPSDEALPTSHPRNRQVISTKGCLTTDQITDTSALKRLYEAPSFRKFLCSVLGLPEIHEYADSLSSINLHFASEGQQLGWHFDNSSFAITLMIQSAEQGGVFEYVRDVKTEDDPNYEMVESILEGRVPVETLHLEPGTLVVFRGKHTLHQVTPVRAGKRVLAVLAYNTEPGIALSESARETFFGRLE